MTPLERLNKIDDMLIANRVSIEFYEKLAADESYVKDFPSLHEKYKVVLVDKKKTRERLVRMYNNQLERMKLILITL